MKIMDFLNSIKPTIFKKDVISIIDNLQQEIENTTLPIYVDLNREIGKKTLKGKEIIRLLPTFKSLVRKRKGELVPAVKYVIEQANKVIEFIHRDLRESLNEANPTDTLTIKKAQYLQIVEVVGFLSRYSRKLASYLLASETEDIKALSRAETNYVISNFSNFCTVLNAFSDPFTSIIKDLSKLANMNVTEADQAEAVLGKKAVDPLSLGFINPKINPFFYLGKWYADYQVKRYIEAKEERELINLRILNMQRINEKSPDPALEKEINYAIERVRKLDYTIAKMEEEWG